MTTNQYGYMGYYKPPKPPSLAQAAGSTTTNILGLSPSARSMLASPAGAATFGLGASRGFATPGRPAPAPPSTSITTRATPSQASLLASALSQAGVSGANGQQQPPTAAGVNSYDLNTDPALQQIRALVGLSDQQAQAGALQQRQNLLLAYGDPTVASAVLGASDPFVQAVGANPTSTVKQLGQQRDRNLQQLDEQLNQQNLGYSGYRVTQEQQAAQDFQNALAQAAAGLNSNLDSVSGNLASALAANRSQLASGINDAETRAAATGVDPGAAAAAPAGGAAAPPVAFGGGAGVSGQQPGLSYLGSGPDAAAKVKKLLGGNSSLLQALIG